MSEKERKMMKQRALEIAQQDAVTGALFHLERNHCWQRQPDLEL